MRKILMAAALVAAPMMAAPGVAQAQPVDGVYIGAGAGANFLTGTKIRSPGTGSLKSDIGFVGLGSVGYGFGNGVRVELEGNFRQQTVKSGAARGTLRSFGPMVNVLFDFDAGLDFMYPYVGVGVGGQFGSINGLGTSADAKGTVAAQGILGAAFPTGVDGLSITTEARVISTVQNVKYSNAGANGSTNPQLNVSGLIGLRYAFSGPAAPPLAPPLAPPVAAAVRTYLVFFDWDKADLTASARTIIANAAQASTAVATTRIEVGGHADQSGTARYNQAISLRRANAVAAELVRLGVARGNIAIQAFGQSKPLVAATGREPQNRRVEIVLK